MRRFQGTREVTWDGLICNSPAWRPGTGLSFRPWKQAGRRKVKVPESIHNPDSIDECRTCIRLRQGALGISALPVICGEERSDEAIQFAASIHRMVKGVGRGGQRNQPLHQRRGQRYAGSLLANGVGPERDRIESERRRFPTGAMESAVAGDPYGIGYVISRT